MGVRLSVAFVLQKGGRIRGPCEEQPTDSIPGEGLWMEGQPVPAPDADRRRLPNVSEKTREEVRGVILERKNTITTIVDLLSSFASEVTRVAREVGTDGKLGGQAEVEDVAGTRKDSTHGADFMTGNLSRQVRNVRRRDQSGGQGRLIKKITVDVKERDLRARKHTVDTMVDHLGSNESEVTRGARGAARRGEAGRPGRREGRRWDVEGPYGQRQLHGQQPDHQVRNIAAGHHRGGRRRPVGAHGKRGPASETPRYLRTCSPWISPRQAPVASPLSSMKCSNRSRSPWTRRETKPSASPSFSVTPSGS